MNSFKLMLVAALTLVVSMIVGTVIGLSSIKVEQKASRWDARDKSHKVEFKSIVWSSDVKNDRFLVEQGDGKYVVVTHGCKGGGLLTLESGTPCSVIYWLRNFNDFCKAKGIHPKEVKIACCHMAAQVESLKAAASDLDVEFEITMYDPSVVKQTFVGDITSNSMMIGYEK